MTTYRNLMLAALFAVSGGLATISGATAADVKVINRLSADCVVQNADLKIPISAKSEKAATIPDELGEGLNVICKESGLDKDETGCKLVIGGTGGSGNSKDESYDFKYVKEIHVFSQVGQFLVCSAL